MAYGGALLRRRKARKRSLSCVAVAPLSSNALRSETASYAVRPSDLPLLTSSSISISSTNCMTGLAVGKGSWRMAKRRHGRPARPRKKRGQSGRGDGIDLDDVSTRMIDEDLFTQGIGSEYLEGAESLLARHSKFLTSLRKNFAHWIIVGGVKTLSNPFVSLVNEATLSFYNLVLTMAAALSWLTYFTLTSTGVVRGLSSMPLFKSDAIAFYHPSQNSYVACIEQPKPADIPSSPSKSRGSDKPRPRYRVKEALDVFQAPSTDSDLIALAEPGDTITIFERRKDWIRHTRGLVVEGWSKIERRGGREHNARKNATSPQKGVRSQIERIRDTENLLFFECYSAAGSGRGSSKLASPYRMVLTKKEIPSDVIWRIPLFAQSSLYDRARLMGSGHGCIWCSDALLLGMSPIIWTFVNLPLGLFISLGTLLTDLVAFEIGEMWSLVILCTGCMWFCLCLLATYTLELRSSNYELVSETRWWLQLQFLTRPFFDLIILSVGIFLVGPCLAVPIYIFLLVRFYSLPVHSGSQRHSADPNLPFSPSEHSRTSSIESTRTSLLAGVTASALSQRPNSIGDSGDDTVHRDDTQVIYTCSLLRDRFLSDHLVMTAIFVTVCLTSHAFRVWRLFPDVRWIAVPQLYLFYCILKRGTPDGYIAVCFAWQCFGLVFALRTGGWVSYLVYVVFCKDFDHPNPQMPWREYTLKQVIAIGCFSLACGAVGIVPALLMFLTTLAKNPKAYLSANPKEMHTANRTKKSKKFQGPADAPDYCRVVADFLVKLGLVLMARALVSEFRCSRWLDFNLTNFLSYAVDLEIDNRSHMSLLTILGGGVATSIARRNWIPNLCWYAAGGRTILKHITCHRESSYSGSEVPSHEGGAKKHRQGNEQADDDKSPIVPHRETEGVFDLHEDEKMNSVDGATRMSWQERKLSRERFVAYVESTMNDSNVRVTAYSILFLLALFFRVPVMCLLPLLMPDPWEQILGPSFWTLAAFLATLLSHTPNGFLAAFDLTILGFGFMSWALKDYDERDIEDDEVFMKESLSQPAEAKMSVAQKLKIGLEDRAVVGDIKAQFQMANLYAREGDVLKATDWYRQAANHGNREAQIAVANSYLVGKGVEKDKKLAMWWFERAAEQGSQEARKKLSSWKASGIKDCTEIPEVDNSRIESKAEKKGSTGEESGSFKKYPPNGSEQQKVESENDRGVNASLLTSPSGTTELDATSSQSSVMIHRGTFSLEVGTTFWGFISHPKLWRMPVKVEGRISGGIYPNFVGEWTAIGKVSCESQAVFINIKAYGVVILGDRTTQAHLVFVEDGRMEGEVFQEGEPGGTAVLEVQNN